MNCLNAHCTKESGHVDPHTLEDEATETQRRLRYAKRKETTRGAILAKLPGYSVTAIDRIVELMASDEGFYRNVDRLVHTTRELKVMAGRIDLDCESCKNAYATGDTMMPPHTASSGCESGKRNHCTCDVCY